MSPDRGRLRRASIDWARGLAVLLMIQAHATDAWTRRADRTSRAFGDAVLLGGFAAPLFLWLAGMSAVLAASHLTRTSTRAQAAQSVARRGLEIFVLAFLFRLQAFLVSPGSHVVMLFRVDILNVMGPAIALTGVVWAITSSRPAMLFIYASSACLLAMVTPIVRAAAAVDSLPLFLQWYVRPFGDFTTFTMFPWAGFVFAGAACGVVLEGARDAAAERNTYTGFAAAGLGLVALGWYTAKLPTIYQHSSFWNSSPTWFAIRVGVMMVAVALLHPLTRAAERWKLPSRPLVRFGRNSLFVYWIHVELVYGYASWLWRGRLPLWATFTACAAFCVLMYGAIVLRDRVVSWWDTRPAAGSRRPRHQPAPVLWSTDLTSQVGEKP